MNYAYKNGTVLLFYNLFTQVLNIFPYSLIALYGDTIVDLINTYSWKFKKMLIKMNILVSPPPRTIILLEHVSRNGISRTKSMCIFKVFIKKKKPTHYQDIPEKGYFNSHSSSNSG